MMRWKSIAITVAITTVYVIVGAVILHFLEQSNEIKVRATVEEEINKLIQEHPCINRSDLNELFVFLDKSATADIYFHPLIEGYNVSSWSLQSSIFLSCQLIIGLAYGNIIPRTVGGRVFVVFYTLIGFPFFIITGIAIGEFFIMAAEKLRGKMQKGAMATDTSKIKNHAFGIILILLVGAAIFVVLPSIVFMVIEGWNYEEALYFVFISLFNLGFGDYIPASELPNLFTIRNFNTYRLIVGFYLLLMALWFATIITAIYEAVVALSYKGEAKKVEKERNKMSRQPVSNEGAVSVYTGDILSNKSKSKTTVQNSNTGVTNVYFN